MMSTSAPLGICRCAGTSMLTGSSCARREPSQPPAPKVCGPQTFGAGGWEGSRLAQELPVNMEVPAQRQIPKGALVLIMDPAEAADGNYWGMQCAIKASEALSTRDEIGVI